MTFNLAKEGTMLQTIVSSSQAVCFIKDKDGHFVFVNDAFALGFGVKKEDVIGKTDFDFQPKELVKKFQENDQKVREAQKAMTFKEEVNINGEIKTFASHKFPVSNLSEYPNAVAGICLEITQLS